MNDYKPIQTDKDRRAETIEGVLNGSIAKHLKHRLSLKTIGKEVFNHIVHKVLPHGADEIGNLFWTSNAYWPGSGGNTPKPIAAPLIEPLRSPTETVHGVSGPLPDIDDNPYTTGGYKPEPPPGGPGGLYLTLDGNSNRPSSLSSDTLPDLSGASEPQPGPNPGGPSGMYLGPYEQAKQDATDRGASFTPSDGHTR